MKSRFSIAAASTVATGLALMVAMTASAATLSRQLDVGMSGSDVSALQTYLATDASIYPQGLVTGFYGPLTAAAVARFQTAHSLASVGRVGPLTLIALNVAMGNSASIDDSAPIITPETVITTPNTANIAWTSNEAAYARVMYGNTWPFLYASAPSVNGANGLSMSQNVTLTGLAANSTYYYVLESKDPSGNVTWTIGKALATKP